MCHFVTLLALASLSTKRTVTTPLNPPVTGPSSRSLKNIFSTSLPLSSSRILSINQFYLQVYTYSPVIPTLTLLALAVRDRCNLSGGREIFFSGPKKCSCPAALGYTNLHCGLALVFDSRSYTANFFWSFVAECTPEAIGCTPQRPTLAN